MKSKVTPTREDNHIRQDWRRAFWKQAIYPMLGVSESRVVLFTSNSFGMVVGLTDSPKSPASIARVGEKGEWAMEVFDPFNGTVTLEN